MLQDALWWLNRQSFHLYQRDYSLKLLIRQDCPDGVFNLIYGEGVTVGVAISHHPDIDMVSFTGSTRAGIAVAQAAATNVKRVCQELGGKSPMILTEGN